MVVVSVLALWHAARLVALAGGYVIALTVRLVRQGNAQTYSPDRRYWWNGRAWIETLPSISWIIPAGSVVVLLVVAGVCTASLGARPSASPGTVAVAVSSPTNAGTSFDAAPSPSPSPRTPSPSPVARPPSPSTQAPPAAAPNTCGAPLNPWGYNFCGGSLIYSPPSNFCAYFNCIKSFWQSTKGYVDECHDGTYSHSGGRQGACSYHGGELRPLYSH
jgi:hypothetical protein